MPKVYTQRSRSEIAQKTKEVYLVEEIVRLIGNEKDRKVIKK